MLANQALYCLRHISNPFCSDYFLEMGSCPGWPQTKILPLSASQVARITGVSHQHLAWHVFFKVAEVSRWWWVTPIILAT
jgi:hypothetical protein